MENGKGVVYVCLGEVGAFGTRTNANADDVLSDNVQSLRSSTTLTVRHTRTSTAVSTYTSHEHAAERVYVFGVAS